MKETQDSVKRFMERSKQAGSAELGARLILEEAIETITALGFHPTVKLGGKFELAPITVAGTGERAVDLVEAIDGLCDVIYVCLWTACALKVDLTPFMDEVCENNLLKTVNPQFDDNGKLVKPDGHPRPQLQRIYDTLYVPRFERTDAQPATFAMRLVHRDAWQSSNGVIFLQGPTIATDGLARSYTDLKTVRPEEFSEWEDKFL